MESLWLVLHNQRTWFAINLSFTITSSLMFRFLSRFDRLSSRWAKWWALCNSLEMVPSSLYKDDLLSSTKEPEKPVERFHFFRISESWKILSVFFFVNADSDMMIRRELLLVLAIVAVAAVHSIPNANEQCKIIYDQNALYCQVCWYLSKLFLK